MSAKAALAQRILEDLAQGRSVPERDAMQLRNWANSHEEAMLSLKELAPRILDES